MKILIVEDDKISRMALEVYLKKLSHEVITAEDGRKGLSLFYAENPQIVITDWMMPELNGLELCRHIRSNPASKYTYILLLTALSGKSNYLEGMNAGADDFVTKPIDIAELRARLRVAERILNLQAEVKKLEGLLPICTACKKIRDEHGDWAQLEAYITNRSDATFSHGMCPGCMTQYYPEFVVAEP